MTRPWKDVIEISRRGGVRSHTRGGIEVILSRDECFEGHLEGRTRRGRAVMQGRHHFEVSTRCDTCGDIEGACSEVAVARALGVCWSPSTPTQSDWHRGDVGGWEVRSTTLDNGHLIIKVNDPADRPFILATGTWPCYILRGWMLGRDAKQDGYLNPDAPGGPCYYVPQKDLTKLTGDEGPWRGGEAP